MDSLEDKERVESYLPLARRLIFKAINCRESVFNRYEEKKSEPRTEYIRYAHDLTKHEFKSDEILK